MASALDHQDLHKGSEADKILAVGARILASMTPFVAAAAQRISTDDLFVLTNRLHQIMLSAAGLASRQRGQVIGANGGGSAPGAEPAGGVDALRSPSGHPVDVGALQSSTLSNQLQQQAGSASSTGPLSARLQRLAARKEAAQHRRQQRQLRQLAKRQRRGLREAAAGGEADLPGPSWGMLGLQGHLRSGSGLDSGMRDKALKKQQLVGANATTGVTGEDLTHPWSWDITQPLTVLTGGIKVGLGYCCSACAVWRL